MTRRTAGRESRKIRTSGGHSGFWASSSQDFARLANLLFAESRRCAEDVDGNCSIYTLAGIPMLFSALRCLLIELNSGILNASPPRQRVLEQLANATSEIRVILNEYPVSKELQAQLRLLLEVRHEIIHPAHRPGPEPSNTPAYLRQLRDAGLLQSTGKDTDFLWIAQLKSHRLFRWAFEVCRETVTLLVREHHLPRSAAESLSATYSEYLAVDDQKP